MILQYMCIQNHQYIYIYRDQIAIIPYINHCNKSGIIYNNDPEYTL